jgi:hypothetical protein
MAFSNTFTVGLLTEADNVALLASLVALDVSATMQHVPGSPDYVVTKGTTWTQPQIDAVQNIILSAVLRLSAQAEIDQWPIALKAMALALIDQLNTIRVALPVPLGAITPAQALAAIRSKAGTL